MNIFIGISLTIVIAALFAGILQKLKQPLIIGHVLTGLIVGPFLFKNIQFQEVFDSLANFGIALLLFIIGLSLTPKVIKEVGKSSFLTGFGQILITSVAGFFVSRYILNFNVVTSLYLGLALTFSSTIIIMKLLSDKKELSKFYSKISIGLLLIQDLIVALILIGISAFSSGEATVTSISLTVIKGVVVCDLIILFTIYIIPMLSASFAKSQEFLFLFSIAWGLGIATLFHFLGFSMEIGALIAGVALSTSPYHFEISSRLRPLRDFFVILFFILLGSKIKLNVVSSNIYPIAILSAFVIFVKPILVMFLTGGFGYKKKVTFLTAINFTQVSEFSLILLILAEKVSGLSSDIVPILTFVSLVSIAFSSYLVLYGNKIYPYLQKLVFERKIVKNCSVKNEYYDVIQFGCNRVGYDFLEIFKEEGKKFLVIDYDPETIKKLEELKINCRYGDADDNDFLEELNFDKAKMVISTIPDFEINQFIISKVRTINEESPIIVISHEVSEAIGLYEAGATYVITPHFLGGKYASMLISKYGFDLSKFLAEKDKHLKDLEKRQETGYVQTMPELYR
jgi:Kef-type K+ transport system membrane component KefB/Trk K+ transport system NAD-binding subunit